jgi:hypothetical protein
VKKRRDFRLLALAVVLLAIPALWLAWSSRAVRERREATLAGVPQFPAPGQQPRPKPFPVTRPAAPPPPPSAAKPPSDPMLSFVLQPANGVGLVQVNALFNTPFFERLRQCLPNDFRSLEENGREIGIDFSRDVDRVAMAPGGMAISGFFEGKPVAQKMARPGSAEDHYRGATLFSLGSHCTAQMGNLVIVSNTDECRELIDRALMPVPADAQQQVYGEIFLKSDLAPLRTEETAPQIRALLDELDGVTLRANVWDSMAVTLEGRPRPGRNVRDLAQIARGAMTFLRGQLDEDQIELQALADLAKVSPESGQLEIELALPASDLFDRLHFPCPGRDGGS